MSAPSTLGYAHARNTCNIVSLKILKTKHACKAPLCKRSVKLHSVMKQWFLPVRCPFNLDDRFTSRLSACILKTEPSRDQRCNHYTCLHTCCLDRFIAPGTNFYPVKPICFLQVANKCCPAFNLFIRTLSHSLMYTDVFHIQIR